MTIVSPKKLGINLTRDLKGLHTENAKTMIKKLNRHKKMARYPMLMSENIVKISILPEATHTCNHYQYFSDIFHRNNFNICMEPQRTQKGRSDPENEKRLVASFPLTSTHIKQLMAPQDMWN